MWSSVLKDQDPIYLMGSGFARLKILLPDRKWSGEIKDPVRKKSDKIKDLTYLIGSGLVRSRIWVVWFSVNPELDTVELIKPDKNYVHT